MPNQQSKIVAAAIALASRALKLFPVWHPNLINCTGYEVEELWEYEKELLAAHLRMSEKKEQKKRVSAVDYATRKFESVSKLLTFTVDELEVNIEMQRIVETVIAQMDPEKSYDSKADCPGV